jgi:hypothetical protein
MYPRFRLFFLIIFFVLVEAQDERFPAHPHSSFNPAFIGKQEKNEAAGMMTNKLAFSSAASAGRGQRAAPSGSLRAKKVPGHLTGRVLASDWIDYTAIWQAAWLQSPGPAAPTT